jgi:hypothetical protein
MIRKRCAAIEIKMDIIGSKSLKKGYYGGSTMPLISTKECLCLSQASTWISTLDFLVFIAVSDFEVRDDCLFC